jgi:hypothetical protein
VGQRTAADQRPLSGLRLDYGQAGSNPSRPDSRHYFRLADDAFRTLSLLAASQGCCSNTLKNGQRRVRVFITDPNLPNKSEMARSPQSARRDVSTTWLTGPKPFIDLPRWLPVQRVPRVLWHELRGQIEVTCLSCGKLNKCVPRMLRPLGVLSLLFSLAPAAVAQVPPSKPSTSKADHSQEAFVIEQFSRKERFENDGTSSKEDTGRVRIFNYYRAQRELVDGAGRAQEKSVPSRMGNSRLACNPCTSGGVETGDGGCL